MAPIKKRKKKRYNPYNRKGNPGKRICTGIEKLCETLDRVGVHTGEEQAQKKAAQKEKKRKENDALEAILWKEREKALLLLCKKKN